MLDVVSAARSLSVRAGELLPLELLRRQGLQGVLRLPAPLKRIMAGAPVVVEGQTLDLDTQLVLRIRELVREPAVEDLDWTAARALMVAQARLVGGQQRIGHVRPCRVAGLPGRLYVPTGALVHEAGRGDALLLFFHGGGFCFGDLDSHDALCRFLARRAGVRVLSVDYRLAPEHPAPAAFDDAWAAFRWVGENAGWLGADAERIAVGGDSAGGNLAALVALRAAAEGRALRQQLLIYPATDLTASFASHATFGEGFYLTTDFIAKVRRAYVPDAGERDDPEISPLAWARSAESLTVPPAPAYVATAGFDPLRDEGEAYAEALEKAGTSVTLRRFETLIHGFANWVDVGAANRAALEEIAAALANGLGWVQTTDQTTDQA